MTMKTWWKSSPKDESLVLVHTTRQRIFMVTENLPVVHQAQDIVDAVLTTMEDVAGVNNLKRIYQIILLTYIFYCFSCSPKRIDLSSCG